jgi:hypothetical protein
MKFGIASKMDPVKKNTFICSVGKFVGLGADRFVDENGNGCDEDLYIKYFIKTTGKYRNLQEEPFKL